MNGIFSDYSVQHIGRNRILKLYIIMIFPKILKLDCILIQFPERDKNLSMFWIPTD